MNDAEVIAKARALIDHGPYCLPVMAEMIEQLADIAEKHGAMLLDERTSRIFLLRQAGSWETCQQAAAKELAIEESQWRKIGEKEVEAIEYALNRIDERSQDRIPFKGDQINPRAEILRRLIDSGHHIGEVNEMVSEEEMSRDTIPSQNTIDLKEGYIDKFGNYIRKDDEYIIVTTRRGVQRRYAKDLIFEMDLVNLTGGELYYPAEDEA
jgi:hypothetical protein